MSIAEYGFRPGSHLQPGAPRDAEIVAKRLEKLRKKNRLTPEHVLEDAANPLSPLHPYFEWDDSAAAKEYRLIQARQLIRSVVVSFDGQPTINSYVHIAAEEENYYERTDVAMVQVDTREYVLRRAHRELMAWQERYAQYEEFAAVFAAAKKVRVA
jgi:hypothetical protein